MTTLWMFLGPAAVLGVAQAQHQVLAAYVWLLMVIN
jgi:hypothetical protein